MHIDVLTLFPDMFTGPLTESIVKRAIEKKKLSIDLINIRDFAHNKHRQVDDYAFGGSRGMVMKPEPLFEAIDFVKKKPIHVTPPPIIYMSPQGESFTQKIAIELSTLSSFVLLCGHYKDIDYRVRQYGITREISIGDYVLSGGELPAMVIIDAVARLQKGVLTHQESAETDSFHQDLLDCPYYTRPREYRGYTVPEVLLSGNHKAIAEWQQKQRIDRTKKRRGEISHD